MIPSLSPRALSILLGLAALTPACAPSGDGAEAPAAAPVDAAVKPQRRVSTLVVRPRSFAERIEVAAVIEAPRDATLSARASGTVRTLVALGATVEAGAVVARLDDGLQRAVAGQARAQIESAQAALALARDNQRRQKPLFDRQIISALEFQGIESQLAQAEAPLAQVRAARDSAEEQIAVTRVVTPFGGTVEERFVEAGEQVSPGQRVLRVVDTAVVKVTAGVPERYSVDIVPGAAVEVRFSAYGIGPRQGEVAFVGRTIDPQNRTFPVEVRLDNAEGAFKPQMVARLVLTRATLADALVLPQSALVLHESGQSVFVVDRGVAGRPSVSRRVEAEIGARSAGEVVITAGLKPGDEVVVIGQASLAGGDPVEVVSGDGG